jgi:CheY-like chemotaxis protein
MTCPLPGEEPLRQRLAVDGYLIKPVSRQSLWDMLHQFGETVDRILVIDDDRDFVSLLNRMLISPTRNYRVTSAYSGWEGLDLVRRNQPDLILLDMVLSDMMGTQVVERIRENPRWRQIPIVIISGEDEVDYQEAVYGEVTIAKKNGLMPGEIVQWVQHMVDGTMYGGMVPDETH